MSSESSFQALDKNNELIGLGTSALSTWLTEMNLEHLRFISSLFTKYMNQLGANHGRSGYIRHSRDDRYGKGKGRKIIKRWIWDG